LFLEIDGAIKPSFLEQCGTRAGSGVTFFREKSAVPPPNGTQPIGVTTSRNPATLEDDDPYRKFGSAFICSRLQKPRPCRICQDSSWENKGT
jgi:hypothetical protein